MPEGQVPAGHPILTAAERTLAVDLSRCQARSGCQAAIAPAREAVAAGPVGGLGSGEMADHLLGVRRLGVVAVGERDGQRLDGEVAALDQPLVVLLAQQRAGEPITAWSLGKIPTTSVRLPISLLTRSNGLVERILVQCSLGNV